MAGARVVQTRPIEESVALYGWWLQENRPRPAWLLLNMETGEFRVDDERHPAVHARPMTTPWRKWRMESLTLEAAHGLLQDAEPVAQRILDSSYVLLNPVDCSYEVMWPHADGVLAFREIQPMIDQVRRRRARMKFAAV